MSVKPGGDSQPQARRAAALRPDMFINTAHTVMERDRTRGDTNAGDTSTRSHRRSFVWEFLVGLSTLALTAYHPAQAEDLWLVERNQPREATNETDPIDVNIPAGDLHSALLALGRQTPLQLLYPPKLVTGLRTQGLQGRYTPSEVLEKLLAGTGLRYRFSDANTVTLQRAEHSETTETQTAQEGAVKPVRVPEVVVKDTKELVMVVDQPDGYKADVSSEALLRFPTSIQELPQSVSVVTRDSIQERRAVTQQEALEGVAGIGKSPQFVGLVANDYVIRGFSTVQNSPGGFRDNGLSAFNNYVADPTLYQRIEVIKGPASFTSGLVTAGGFVNRLLKAPEYRNFVVGEAGAGSHGHYRTTLDANGVMPNLPVAGRLVFTQNEDPEFFRNTGNQRFSFLPSVRFTPREDFTLTITGNVQHLGGKGNIGTSTTTLGTIPAGIENSFLAHDNRLENDYRSVHVEAEKKFAQSFRLKAKGQYSHSDTSYRYGFSYQPGGIGLDGNFSIYGLARQLKRESFAGEINLTKDFSIFGNLSSVAVGMDYSLARQNTITSDFPFLGMGNIANPDNNLPVPSELTSVGNGNFRQTGAYAQGLLRPFAGTTLMVALRGNWITQESFNGTEKEGVNVDRLTPQIGLSQRLIEGLNVYASYGESIQPNFGITRDGSILDPITGKTTEIGTKWEPLGPRMRLTAALFRTKLDNVSNPDPSNPFFSIGGQSERNQGFEFEAQGAPLPELRVNLAYTYLDTELTKSTIPNTVGSRAWNAPAHTVSAFGSYDFSTLLTRGLKLGAVIYYRSGVSSNPGLNQTYAGYTRADIFAIYAPLSWLSLQVNLNNIADARYIEGPLNYSGFNHFGAPRHVIGMVRMTF